MDDAANFGARGTPNFFINGRNFRGAQPLEAFKSVDRRGDQEGRREAEGGTPRGQLYAELTKDGLDKAAPAAAAARAPGRARRERRAYRADVKGAPVKGAKDALGHDRAVLRLPVPVLLRASSRRSRKVMKEYKGKVRVAWRDLPLPFHPNAMPAADRGARRRRAGQVLGDARQDLRQPADAWIAPTYEKYAQELGLNMGKFKAALDAEKGKDGIEADAAAGGKIGARGTPAFFINGKFLSGAQPFEAFKAKIDEELKNAEALVAKGTPKAKVYDVLMKDAKTEVAGGAGRQARPRRRRAPSRTRRSTRSRPATRRRRGRRTRR